MIHGRSQRATMNVDVRRYQPIDCDIHPAVPNFAVLLPYLDDHWRQTVLARGIDRLDFDLTCYPAAAPLSGRPDWRSAQGHPGSDLAQLRRQALDHFDSRFAICNVVHGVQGLFNADMAAAFCRAINDWLAAEVLACDQRLRASIVIPWQDVALSVSEIERCASDPRFVQVMMLVQGETPSAGVNGGRSMKPRSTIICLSASTPEASIVTRQPQPAGPVRILPTMSPTVMHSSRRC